MRSTRRGLFRRGRHDGGASAVEYALILAGIALVGVATIYLLGRSVKGAFVAAEGSVSSTTQPSSVPSSALPTTTSPAPTTTSPAPTTTSPAPTTTTAQPSATPTTTRPTTRSDAPRGETTKILDLSGTVTNTTVSLSPQVGSVVWNGNNIEITVPNGRGLVGTVITVTYTYTQNGVNYAGTITVTVTN